MRIIVNKKQYNKILHFQQNKNKISEGVVNFIYDSILTYEKKLIIETNIRKNNISKILKNTTLESITIDMFRGNLTEVNIKHLDGMLELDVTLPKNINHTELRNKIFLEMNNPTLLTEQTNLYGLNFDNLSIGDIIAINYLVDRLRKSLGYSKQQMVDKLLFIDGDNTFKNGGVLNIDINKFNDEELSTIIKELEKGNNTNYVLSVDKNGEEIKGIGIDFDNYIALSKPSDDKIVNTDDPIDNDDNTNDDFEEVDLDEVPDGSFTSVIPTKLYPVMYLISDMESGHNYNIQGGERSPSVTLTDKTIKQVSKGGDYGTNAKGRWQLMPKYMLGFAKDAGLKGTDKFSKINQDKMAMSLIKGWENWDCKKFGDELAHIWAPVPVLYDQQGSVQRVNRGESFYEGVGTNKALTTANKFETALRKSCGKEDNSKIKLNKRNFHKIPSSSNYRSGQPTLEELEHIIKTYGIKDIIRMNKKSGGDDDDSVKNDSLKREVSVKEEKELAERLGVNFHFINAHDGYEEGKGYVGSTNKVQPILNKGNTLIHCRNGSDRTGGQVGRYMKDNTSKTDQQLWDETVKYNHWCTMGKSKFKPYGKYGQSFIENLDYDKMKELCNKSNSKEEGTVKDTVDTSIKDGKTKILFIGDSHTVNTSPNYSYKILKNDKYGGTIVAIKGKKPEWMFNQLKTIEDQIKDYDYFVVMGGGNAAYRKTPDKAIGFLGKIYDLIKTKKGKDAKIIGITPPHKRYSKNKYPSNQEIADFVIKQKGGKLIHVIDLTKSHINKSFFRKDMLHLSPTTHDQLMKIIIQQIKKNNE